jgi:hypothetical protein
MIYRIPVNPVILSKAQIEILQNRYRNKTIKRYCL